VKEQTKLRIWSTARDYNFPTYRYQSSRSSKSDGVIAAIIPRLPMRGARLTDPFVQELLANISEAARERNCSLQISYSAPSSEEEFGTLIRSIRADGLVFIGQGLIHDSLQRLGIAADFNAPRYRTCIGTVRDWYATGWILTVSSVSMTLLRWARPRDCGDMASMCLKTSL